MFLIPVIMMPLGIAAFYACRLGSDPFSVFIEGQHALTGLTRGQITTINNSALLLIMLIFGRKYIGMGTVIMTFSIGPLIDFFRSAIYQLLLTGGDFMPVRVAVMVAGCVVFSVGVGFYIATEFGIGGLECILMLFTERTGFKMKYVKIVQDATFVLLGFIMGGIIGVGTMLSVLVTGPIIDLTLRFIKDPLKRFVGPLRHTYT